ncbi:putative disease resistance protein RPP1 [Cardamine amara subsp. amara]|uniref:ADP-ribosyl cyclase/cyclic ADP-ribose hydrolase n=1 Tax=Cardamine amara subsp. amara TaxID=228776 RepID=A0ABD0ZM81_CARAN
MASSSLSHIKRYHVFSSFHGPDVRKGFLSHLHTHFASKGITTFNDQEIVRGQTIGPELVQAIRESRVSIVVLSEKYASSSWCLDELVEIFSCKESLGQTVMPIFYKVAPSDVRKQSGDFGKAFEKTCQGKSEEVKQRWSKALADVATIAGEHFLNWANEAKMIEKIATDVSRKLNVTPSRDFEGMVGLEAHLNKLDSLLCLESDEVKMIGIWGPAGIGKSTIARALYNQLSSGFQLRCFMGNLKGTCKIDDYDSKLSLQNQLLSKIFNQKDMEVHHLGAIEERLHDQRVLIVLDDVDDLLQLEVLVKEISWFGSGSRIIITTEDKKILKAHEIHNIYHVNFPSKKEALEIVCRSAFKQSSVPDGYEELAKKVANLCGDLPLGLCVVGSSLRGESKHEWELQLSSIETSLDRKIENILKVAYERLSKKDQSLFLHIACFFNNEDTDYVTSVLADSGLDVRNGLKTLAEKSLMHTDGSTIMHYLLQQLGRQIVVEQSDEPGKRQFLLEVKEIRDVLANETGTGSVIGISLDKSTIGNDHHVSVGKRAFDGMRNLRYLRIIGGKVTLQIPEDMKYLPRLRLLHWDSYPRKSLPTRFQPECLIELDMPSSNLEKLWGGIQPLPNLKRIDMSSSFKLKEIPNLLNATNLETLTLKYCSSLVELPSSIRNLHKLKKLKMAFCKKLQVVPTNINLASLEEVDMSSCSRLRSFPDISMNIMKLYVGRTKIEEVPLSIRNLHKLKKLDMYLCKKLQVIPSNINLASLEEVDMNSCLQLRSFPDFSMNIRELDVGNTTIEEVPSSIRNLHKLKVLKMQDCKKLQVIPTNINLASLEEVDMKDCWQLESFPDISSNIKTLSVKGTKIKDFPPSMTRCWSCLEWLAIGNRNLNRLTHVPLSVRKLDLSNSDIERIPDCVIGLPHLVDLIVENCPKLVSIPALSPSLKSLNANECVSLKKVCCSFHNQTKRLSFYNCLQLDEESRRGIIQQSIQDYICLPGKEIPAGFTHKSTGNSITIPLASCGEATLSESSRFKACFLLSPIEESHLTITCHLRNEGRVTINFINSSAWLSDQLPGLEHLFIFSGDLFPQRNSSHEVGVTISKIIFDFSCEDIDDKIIECGVQIMTEETEGSSREHATTTTTQMEAERKTKKQKVSR